MKLALTSFSNLASDRYLRTDFKYHTLITNTNGNIFNLEHNKTISLADVIYEDYLPFDFEDDQEYRGIPTGQAYIDEDGEIIDFQLITNDDHPNRLKYFVTNEHILLSSLRLAKAPALNFSIDELNKYVFSNGFYIFKVNSAWDKKFVVYLLRNNKIKQLLDENIYRGIGISSYKSDDLLRIQIKNLTLSEQRQAVERITPVEKTIRSKKSLLLNTQQVIDDVLAREFSINTTVLNDISNDKGVISSTNNLVFNNFNLRFSFRWDKAVAIQEKLIEMCSICKRLDKFIVNTKNGWSPECSESASLFKVLGIDSIQKSTNLSLENVKFTDQNNKNIELNSVKYGDFLSAEETQQI